MARLPNADSGRPDGAAVLTPDDARQATKTGYMRRILTVSMGLAVVVLIGAWAWTAHVFSPRGRDPAAGATTAAPASVPDGTNKAAQQGDGPAAVSASRK
jgi:hypothetical protein